MMIAVTRDVIAALQKEAQAAAPDECCGVLLGDGRRIDQIIPAPNVADNPQVRFEIDPRTLITAHRSARGDGARAVIGYYHSHPAGPARPSPCDQEAAARDGAVWAIVGASGDVLFWRDDIRGFVALPYTIVER